MKTTIDFSSIASKRFPGISEHICSLELLLIKSATPIADLPTLIIKEYDAFTDALFVKDLMYILGFMGKGVFNLPNKELETTLHGLMSSNEQNSKIFIMSYTRGDATGAPTGDVLIFCLDKTGDKPVLQIIHGTNEDMILFGQDLQKESAALNQQGILDDLKSKNMLISCSELKDSAAFTIVGQDSSDPANSVVVFISTQTPDDLTKSTDDPRAVVVITNNIGEASKYVPITASLYPWFPNYIHEYNGLSKQLFMDSLGAHIDQVRKLSTENYITTQSFDFRSIKPGVGEVHVTCTLSTMFENGVYETLITTNIAQVVSLDAAND